MKQIPDAYWTAAHGPVFAYATRDDVHACCVTWRDGYVVAHHDDLLLLPTLFGLPDVSVTGVMQVLDLQNAVGECMSRTSPKWRPRRFTVGEAVFGGHLFSAAVYAPGEEVSRGFGRPPREARA